MNAFVLFLSEGAFLSFIGMGMAISGIPALFVILARGISSALFVLAAEGAFVSETFFMGMTASCGGRGVFLPGAAVVPCGQIFEEKDERVGLFVAH